jgi:hypothetical protein
VRILKRIPDDFWWEVARKCSYATFYHTPIWKELAERTYPGFYRDETFGAILPSGVRVVFPMISTRRRGPLRWLLSTFEGCYGGFIADGPVSPSEAAAIFDHACSLTTYTFHMLDNPIAPPLPDTVTAKLSAIVHETSYMLVLDDDFAAIFSRFSHGRRSAYRSGIKKGVRIRLATSIDDYRAYYISYRDAVNRWGESENYGYQWPLFEQIYQLSQTYPEWIKLWLMIVDEQIVGGRLFYYWNQQVSFWTGTAHRDFLHHNVIPVADTEILRDAISHGYRYFDLNTSGLNQGMVEYKQHFGAVGTPVNVWHFENPILKQAQHTYQQIKSRGRPSRPT